MTEQELMHSINSIIETRIEQKQTAELPWVAREAVLLYPERGQSEFDVLCHYGYCRKLASDALRNMRREDDKLLKDEAQYSLAFPGYKRLQRRYSIERNRVQMAVPTELLTHEERLFKSKELRSMGFGVLQHADEMDDFDDKCMAQGARSSPAPEHAP